jgi:ribosomal protein L12E/L44/L45/RPP1/RPP2
MAVTRLKRKHRKNIARANNKQRVIKQLLSTPVIKNVDIEELKAQFTQKAAPAAPKAEAPVPAEKAAPAATEEEATAE